MSRPIQRELGGRGRWARSTSHTLALDRWGSHGSRARRCSAVQGSRTASARVARASRIHAPAPGGPAITRSVVRRGPPRIGGPGPARSPVRRERSQGL
jgi:hypothetical protein